MPTVAATLVPASSTGMPAAISAPNASSIRISVTGRLSVSADGQVVGDPVVDRLVEADVAGLADVELREVGLHGLGHLLQRRRRRPGRGRAGSRRGTPYRPGSPGARRPRRRPGARSCRRRPRRRPAWPARRRAGRSWRRSAPARCPGRRSRRSRPSRPRGRTHRSGSRSRSVSWVGIIVARPTANATNATQPRIARHGWRAHQRAVRCAKEERGFVMAPAFWPRGRRSGVPGPDPWWCWHHCPDRPARGGWSRDTTARARADRRPRSSASSPAPSC